VIMFMVLDIQLTDKMFKVQKQMECRIELVLVWKRGIKQL
jgi:hypothetical protein